MNKARNILKLKNSVTKILHIIHNRGPELKKNDKQSKHKKLKKINCDAPKVQPLNNFSEVKHKFKVFPSLSALMVCPETHQGVSKG